MMRLLHDKYCFLLLFLFMERLDCVAGRSPLSGWTRAPLNSNPSFGGDSKSKQLAILDSIKGGFSDAECTDICNSDTSRALGASAALMLYYAASHCFPEEANDKYLSEDAKQHFGRNSKVWHRWFTLGIFQQACSQAAAALSKDSDTKKNMCIGSALTWAAYIVMNIVDNRRGDLQETQVNINVPIQFAMSMWTLAASGLFDNETAAAK